MHLFHLAIFHITGLLDPIVFLKKNPIILYNGASIYSPTFRMSWLEFCPHCCQCLFNLDILIIVIHSGMVHFSLWFWFAFPWLVMLKTTFVIFVSSFLKCLFRSIVHLYNFCLSFLNVLVINSFSDVCKNFLLFCRLSFLSFDYGKLLNLM
jgi:hypothetical protein